MTKRLFETRFNATEARADGEGKGVIEGYPVVYDKPAVIHDWDGDFTEYIDRGALDNCDLTDVRFFVNHDGNGITLARSRRNNENSTMQLTPDDKGLHMRAVLDVDNNQQARALYSAIQRGDVDGMSFCFTVDRDEWSGLDTDNPTRHIKAIKWIREVSAVNEPAYPDTSISARSGDEGHHDSALERARNACKRTAEAERRAALELAKAKMKIYTL